MNKILILYKSKYGTTKQYAEMLKTELNSDIAELDHFRKSNYRGYETIIFAGFVRMGRINAVNTLRKVYSEIKTKNIVILCVGGTAATEKNISEIKKSNLKNDLQSVPFFYLQGIVNIDKMNFIDRAICKIGQKVSEKSGESNSIFDSGAKNTVNIKNLQPLVNHVKLLNKSH